MSTIARITAIVLVVLGIIILFSGLAIGVTGAIRTMMNAASAARPLRAGGLTGLFVIAFIITHGLLMSAAGEGLYLLAGLSRR